MRILLSPYLLLVITMLCWAGNFILGRAVHGDIPPVTLTFWRWAVAGAALAPFAGAGLWRSRALIARHWRLLAVLAVMGVVLFHVCVYTALQTTTAINAALILATVPVVIPGFAYLLDRDRVSGRQAIGIALSLVGVAVIIVRGDPVVVAGLAFAPGDLWMLVSVPVWSVYTVLLRRLPKGLPPLAMILAISAMGLIPLAPAYAWEIATVGGIAVNAANLVSIGYVSLFASVIAYICFNRAVGVVGATKGGLFLHLMPVFATLMAIALLGEQLRLFHAAGIALIVGGIYLTITVRAD